jgi:hypothetical protein
MIPQLKFNKERFNFTFDDEGKYIGGITLYDGIIIKKIFTNKTWTLDIPISGITCENTAIYNLDSPDSNAKITGFIPIIPFNITETSSEFKIDLRIKPGSPAQFLEDELHLSGLDYAHPGIYQGKFKINIYMDEMLMNTEIISYTMDLKKIN